MIRFSCSSSAFEPYLTQVLDYEIDYLSSKEGILYISEDQVSVLELFCAQMSSEHNIELTCLVCYGQDELTYQALLLAQTLGVGQVHYLSTVLLVALIQNHTKLLKVMNNFVSNLDHHLMEFSRAYISQGGNGVSTAQVLFVHRNTVNNRLAQFEQMTQMDLRIADTRESLKIMLTNQYYG